jgi:hypothetical protein
MSFGMFFHFFTLDFLILFIASKGSNECLRIIERESKQEGGKIEKIKKLKKGRGKRIAKS